MNDRRSFFKSLAMIGAAAVGCPGIFIPKFEPVKWKPMLPGSCWSAADLFGEWQFVQTTYRLQCGMWVPDDQVNFKPYPHDDKMAMEGMLLFDTLPALKAIQV